MITSQDYYEDLEGHSLEYLQRIQEEEEQMYNELNISNE